MKLRQTLLAFAAVSALSATTAYAAEISIVAGSVGRDLEVLQTELKEFEAKTGHKVNVVSMPSSTTDQFGQYKLWLAAQNSDIDVYRTDVIWAPQLASQFIDLTEADEGLEPYTDLLAKHQAAGVLQLRFPIRDQSTPTRRATTVATLDAVDRCLQDGRTVYVHCWGGIGRTGLTVGCWLARHGLGGERALYRLRELWQACPKSAWRQSPETPEQEQYVVGWNDKE